MFKKISKAFLFSAVSFCVLFLFSPSRVDAAKFVKESYTLNSDEILHEDLFIAGGTADINGVVDGDVYIGAQSVTVSGTITGDLYAAAEDIDITGNIYGDSVLCGENLSVSGAIGEKLFLFGGTLNMTGSVTDDLVVIGGNISADGFVDEDLIAVGGDVEVKSSVAEDLVAYGMNLSLDNASVSGTIYQEEGNYSTQDFDFVSNPHLSWGTLFSTTILVAASFYLVGALLIYLMPVKSMVISQKATASGEEFIKSFAAGFVILFIASVPTIILLSITVVAIPVACILTGLLVFLAVYSRLWVELGIGKTVLTYFGEKKSSPYLSLLVGRCISVLISFLPIIGTIYGVILTLAGVGAAFRMKYVAMNPKKK